MRVTYEFHITAEVDVDDDGAEVAEVRVETDHNMPLLKDALEVEVDIRSDELIEAANDSWRSMTTRQRRESW